jgi:DNA-binding NarL/FixJ family response regulator
MSRPLRIVLVEDNNVFRDALVLLLGLRSDIEVVGSLPDGEGLVALCAETGPDVAVIDYRLPGADGVQVTAALRQACPDVVVVVLTASANRSEEDALLAAGAVVCLRKDLELGEIVASLYRAAGRLAPTGEPWS